MVVPHSAVLGFQNSPVVLIDGHENVPASDEDALLKAVACQPVSVAIDAGGMDFQFYSEVRLTVPVASTHMLAAEANCPTPILDNLKKEKHVGCISRLR